MQKKSRISSIVIAVVLALTIYNILPTIFFYSKPLKKTIGKEKALEVSKDIAKRVNDLEGNSLKWINSYAKLINIDVNKINFDKSHPAFIEVYFNSNEDAKIFAKYTSRAGSLIPFIPKRVVPIYEEGTKKVTLKRNVSTHFDVKDLNKYFFYAKKFDENNIATTGYRKVIFDKTSSIIEAVFGDSDKAQMLKKISLNPNSDISKELAYYLSQEIINYYDVFKENKDLLKLSFSSFTRANDLDGKKAIEDLLSSFSRIKEELMLEKSQNKDNNELLDLLEIKSTNIIKAKNIVEKNENYFISNFQKIEKNEIANLLEKKFVDEKNSDKLISYSSKANNLIINEIVIDFTNSKIYLKKNSKLVSYSEKLNKNIKQKYDQIIINEIANITKKTNENILNTLNEYTVKLDNLTNTKSILALNLSALAENEVNNTKYLLKNIFTPKHAELDIDNFPVYDWDTYQKLPKYEQKLCFVIYSPLIHKNFSTKDKLNTNSIYVFAKGLDRIFQKYMQNQNDEKSKLFLEDFQQLKNIFYINNFLGFAGNKLTNTPSMKNDFIFENNNFYKTTILATRENFNIYGEMKYAVLDFTDYEQRILTKNSIENQIHEELMKSSDEYHTAISSMNPYTKFDFAPPSKSIFFNNLQLSFKKYFRGDERKILHWGLDLSGGKSIQIELRDQNNRKVTNEAEIKQGINELNSRVNKMGVSEVNIRQVDSNIALDFPGAQNISANELVKASSMYFHVVNEKFNANNKSLAEHVNRFLAEVWNEAIVTNKKNIKSINEIALKHLYGDFEDSDIIKPRSTSAKILYKNGLRLALENSPSFGIFDDKLSKIAILRDVDQKNNMNPLLIVFNNYALEGSNLKNIRSSFDPSKGNYLSFEISGYQTVDNKKYSATNILHKWTNTFSKEKVAGTSLSNYTRDAGYRMAVILNDSVISAPSLEAPLTDRAMITGSFTQREVNKLVADLKAGSLSFTPHILSEKNVSPELGQMEKKQGILATILALVAIFIAMIAYYRFSGVVASVAVLINLLIMWAALQNIQATLTLAGIAGIILTIGMAVDANVLIFERIKEEFEVSGKLISAIFNGYKKAFSAIIDSNITTIIAALILLHFDAGPIKGFAITLIIGIASSMFTALFLTRYFFSIWIRKTKKTKLRMSNLIKRRNIDFLKHSKVVILSLLAIIFIGGISIIKERSSLLGMDFRGGFSLNIELSPISKDTNYRLLASEAFMKNGANISDFQIREINNANNLRILFSKNMLKKGKPFYNMPISENINENEYKYEKNPRIKWIVNALKSENIEINKKSLQTLDSSWASISGQMSDHMKNNAILGLLIALFAVLIYITWRFEFKYALSAMVCLLHDVMISIATIAILYMMKVPIQIDLHTIAALMTIIGYSLNDTIIIFDRIREDSILMRKSPFKDIINHSLNTTLSRTIVTSLSTLLVLLILVIFGGSTIFPFALTMTIGVIYGTLSSLFIASPLMLFIHKKMNKRKKAIDSN